MPPKGYKGRNTGEWKADKRNTDNCSSKEDINKCRNRIFSAKYFPHRNGPSLTRYSPAIGYCTKVKSRSRNNIDCLTKGRRINTLRKLLLKLTTVIHGLTPWMNHKGCIITRHGVLSPRPKPVSVTTETMPLSRSLRRFGFYAE